MEFIKPICEGVQKYSFLVKDVEYCEKVINKTGSNVLNATGFAIEIITIVFGAYIVSCCCCSSRRKPQNIFEPDEKPNLSLKEKLIQALIDRVTHHTHELSDENPIKALAKKYILAQKIEQATNRVRSWIPFMRR